MKILKNIWNFLEEEAGTDEGIYETYYRRE